MRTQPSRLGFWVGLLAAVFLMTSIADARRRRRRRSVSPQRQARRYFKKGKRHYKKERFEKAIRMFRKAFAILQHKNILLNIAICHAEMGEPVKAMVQLRLALKVVGKTAEELLDRKEYRKLLDMQKRVAILKISAPDPRAVIHLNGESLGTSKMDRVLYPGSYLVEVKLDNKLKVRRTFKLAGGDRKSWIIQSWKSVVAKPSEPQGPGGKGPRGRGLHIAYVTAAAGLTLAAGCAVIGTAVKTQQLKDKYESSGLDPKYKEEGERYKTATNVLAGVTAVAAVATVVLAIFTDWSIFKMSETDTTVLPFTGPGTAGLVVTGRF
jgi:tetratricopeptide (TPR) repeat protein